MPLSRMNSVSMAIASTASCVDLAPSGEPPWPSVPRKWKTVLYRALLDPQLVLLLLPGCQSTKASSPL